MFPTLTASEKGSSGWPGMGENRALACGFRSSQAMTSSAPSSQYPASLHLRVRYRSLVSAIHAGFQKAGASAASSRGSAPARSLLHWVEGVSSWVRPNWPKIVSRTGVGRFGS
jgi:hypothetical protein